MSALEVSLLGAALAFSVVNGINDGGTLVVMGLKIRSVPVWSAVTLLAGAVVVVPLLLGTGVATTLAGRLVPFTGDSGRVAVLAAIVAGTGVTFGLAYRGLPTSLTLGLVGGIAGAGLGSGLPVAWTTVLAVLALGAAAPVVGAGGAFVLSRVVGRLPVRTSAERNIRLLHVLAFGLQCLAYAANDGQKILAVHAVAVGRAAGPVVIPPAHLVVLGLLFALGVVAGLPRLVSTVGEGILSVRPLQAVVAELSAAAAVIATAALSAPVSMTQAVAAGLIGAGASQGYRRVRWRAALRIVLAWMVTLPAAVALGAALGRLGRAWA
ncbi:MAG TPA: inorganic phosphate transporter [Egibacteraceae bacterium]|nr:inorganic phosphate transporter [Actinomycetota bacterium]HWB71061.1 inorganic phosphate transporter [Egibacteraceae bacterium]